MNFNAVEISSFQGIYDWFVVKQVDTDMHNGTLWRVIKIIGQLAHKGRIAFMNFYKPGICEKCVLYADLLFRRRKLLPRGIPGIATISRITFAFFIAGN